MNGPYVAKDEHFPNLALDETSNMDKKERLPSRCTPCRSQLPFFTFCVRSASSPKRSLSRPRRKTRPDRVRTEQAGNLLERLPFEVGCFMQSKIFDEGVRQSSSILSEMQHHSTAAPAEKQTRM